MKISFHDGVQSSGTSPHFSTLKSVPAKEFSKLIGTQASSTTPAQSKIADLMGELTLLAQDVKAGKLTPEEMSRSFAQIVMEKRIDLSAFSKNGVQIKNVVATLIEQDPHFAAQLEAQLKKIN